MYKLLKEKARVFCFFSTSQNIQLSSKYAVGIQSIFNQIIQLLVLCPFGLIHPLTNYLLIFIFVILVPVWCLLLVGNKYMFVE